MSSSDITATSKELEEDTDAVVTCVVNGITQQLDDVHWRKAGVQLNESPNYSINEGTFNPTLFSQTTTLSVAAAATSEDAVYECVITSNEWVETDLKTQVSLDVFGI